MVPMEIMSRNDQKKRFEGNRKTDDRCTFGIMIHRRKIIGHTVRIVVHFGYTVRIVMTYHTFEEVPCYMELH